MNGAGGDDVQAAAVPDVAALATQLRDHLAEVVSVCDLLEQARRQRHTAALADGVRRELEDATVQQARVAVRGLGDVGDVEMARTDRTLLAVRWDWRGVHSRFLLGVEEVVGVVEGTVQPDGTPRGQLLEALAASETLVGLLRLVLACDGLAGVLQDAVAELPDSSADPAHTRELLRAAAQLDRVEGRGHRATVTETLCEEGLGGPASEVLAVITALTDDAGPGQPTGR